MMYTFLWMILALGGTDGATGLTLDDIAAKHTRALGGSEALARLKTLRFSGRYLANGNDNPFGVVYGKGAITFQIEIGGKPITYAWDGKQTRIWDRRRNKPPGAEEDTRTVLFMQRFSQVVSPLADYKKKGLRFSLKGLEKVEGRQMMVLTLDFPGEKPETWYLDPKTWLTVKRIRPVLAYGTTWIEQKFYFDDYRSVGGVMLPHYIEREDYQHVREIVVEKIEVNPSLTEQEKAGLAGWPENP